MRLEGKVALVTGAGSGIGRATVRRFAAEGARVVAADLDAERAEETCAGLDAVPVAADVRDAGAVARMVDTAVERYGGLDVFHNNARIPATVKPLAEISRAEWDEAIDVNLTAFFLAAQAVVPRLRDRGGGAILVTASIIVRRPRAGLAAYIAAKSGVTGLARALALELAPDRIRVNVINPRPVADPDARRVRARARRGGGTAAGPADRARRDRRRSRLSRLRRGRGGDRSGLQRRRRERPLMTAGPCDFT
jgi:3-oxoacyl-[acyl-carrier protein] reductase